MVETLVVDASVGVSLVTPDEIRHDATIECYSRMGAAGTLFVTTPFYAYEVGNTLSRARQKDHLQERFQDARALALPTEPTEARLVRALAIAAESKLSFYDAAYVALGEQVGALVWTEDKQILKRFPERAIDTSGLLARLS
ncbi:MAG: type II toxin-antitoxin system VapC family toxin [Candidatus Thermoplasmatota archaeon]